MKTAISIPDVLFARVEAQIAESGLSRSAFFATAAEQYLAQVEALDVTERINSVLADGDIDPVDQVFVDYNTGRLAATAESW
jgi:hypothetical protein